MSNYNLLFLFLTCFIPLHLYAYLGPGIAGGVIVAILGFIVAIFLALFGILYSPIKRAVQNRKRAAHNKQQPENIQDKN